MYLLILLSFMMYFPKIFINVFVKWTNIYGAPMCVKHWCRCLKGISEWQAFLVSQDLELSGEVSVAYRRDTETNRQGPRV